MKAIRFDECGDYSKLRLVEVPEPERANHREMLVEITAAGNQPDRQRDPMGVDSVRKGTSARARRRRSWTGS
jgi:hypothetical protein